MIHPIFPLHLGLEVTQCCRAQLLVAPGTGGVRSQTLWRSQVLIPSFLQALKQVAASFQPVTSLWWLLGVAAGSKSSGSSIPPAAGASQLAEEQLGHAKDRHCHKSDVSDVANTFNLYQ